MRAVKPTLQLWPLASPIFIHRVPRASKCSAAAQVIGSRHRRTSDILLQNDDSTVADWALNNTSITSSTIVANSGPA